MPFGLCNAPTFQMVMTKVFQKHLSNFMEMFLNNFAMFKTMEQHVDCLQKCFDKYMEYRISINVTKLTLLVPFRKVVGHIVS